MDLRADFPALAQSVNGHPLVYLDSAATSQKPRAVIDAVSRFYAEDNANVHRGVHELAERATAALEGAREQVRRFLGAAHAHEIIFLRGTTEAVNLVAHTYGRAQVGAGDEVIVTALEHHSNLVPWQLLCAERGARLRVCGLDERGALDLAQFERLLSPRTRLIAVTHVSNALGVVNPVREIVARARGVPVFVDGAQAVPHVPVNVRELGCDFYAFSAHKMYGPMGIGALWGRAEHLEAMPPWQAGGEMVREVSFERATWQRPPHKFEAGTPDVGGAVGLGAAIDYLGGLDRAAVLAHERALVERGRAALLQLPGLRLLGASTSMLTFTLAGLHPHDVGTVLDQRGVAVRTGQLCAQPLLALLGAPSVVRASLGLYSTAADLDALVSALHEARAVLS